MSTTNTHSPRTVVRKSTETKAAYKTTEFIVYVLAVIAVIITAAATGDGEGDGGDLFNSLDAMQLITFLTIGYAIARGLAKSGSRERYDDDNN